MLLNTHDSHTQTYGLESSYLSLSPCSTLNRILSIKISCSESFTLLPCCVLTVRFILLLKKEKKRSTN